MTGLYRALLRLYPASFRSEYGEEMTAAFAQAWADATSSGRFALLLRTPAQEVPNAVAVHWAILIQDLRYTARTLNRTRGFALTAILVIALGVGANTAAFSAADFVLLRPLPFEDSEMLVRLCEGPRTGGGWGCMNQLSPSNYQDFKAMSSSFQAMGAYANRAVNLVGGGEPRRLAIASVTSEVLPLLGVKPVLGRVFEAGADDERGTAIVSYGLWQSQFGANPAVIGLTVNLNGAPHTVIGVMPPTFYFPSRDVQLWTPLTFSEQDLSDRTNSYIEGVARLKSDVTFEQAHAELIVVADRLARDYPEANGESGVSFFRMRDALSPRSRLMLIALGGASLCLLLLTCANLANLLLARAASYERELAVRAALGAGKERLVRQLITQSVALALLGGAVGILVAAASMPLFASLVPPTLPIASRPTLDLRVLGLAALFTTLTGLGFGLVPALRAGGRTAFAALREGTRAGSRKQGLRAVLVTVEVTMSVILLIACGLLIRAVWRVQAIDPGFVSQNVLTLRTALPRPKYDSPVRRGQFYDRVLAEVRGLPGVDSAAFITGLPMVMTGGITSVEIPGQPAPARPSDNNASWRFVTPQFFETMGIPILHGRDVEDSDTGARPWVVVVSQSFVDQHWPGQDPTGRSIVQRGQSRTIVGVVGDIRVRGLERTSEPQIYYSALQVQDGAFINYDPKDLVIRHSGQPEAVIPAVRRIVRVADPEQPISDIRTLDEVLAGDTATRRAQLEVLGVLVFVAVLLSGVGIYGLLAFTVSQRSQEIGVRLALGAEPSDVGRMIFRDGMRLALLGIVPGVAGGYAAARGMTTLLFGIAPSDPVTFSAAVGLTLLITVAGSLVPALRAVRVTPMSVLRAE
jgi:putative ABC transport system permease protein